MQIEVSASDLLTRETDSRGRLTLGTDHSDEKVTVAILEVQDVEGDDDE